MRASTLGPDQTTTLRFRVAGSSMLCWPVETIAQHRRKPVVVGNNAMSPSFLKHAEDQTVTAMWAVLAALEGWSVPSFADWGVIAAADFYGRAGIARSVEQFRLEGPWGISPHLIPQQSLHAISGTVSQALKIHGPNFGVSGGPNASPDGFLLAATLLADGSLPGLWLILSGYEREFIPTLETQPLPGCLGIAFALTPDDGSDGMYLSIGTGDNQVLADFNLSELAVEWQRLGNVPSARWRIADTHWIELADWSRAWEEQG